MDDEHAIICDPELGTFSRATTELADGTVLTHDRYAGTVTCDGNDVEVLLEASSPTEAQALLPHLRTATEALDPLRRLGSDAIITAFSDDRPEPEDLDRAASDLLLETVETTAHGTLVLHFVDTSGTHFPQGYWPAVHFGIDGQITRVTVES